MLRWSTRITGWNHPTWFVIRPSWLFTPQWKLWDDVAWTSLICYLLWTIR